MQDEKMIETLRLFLKHQSQVNKKIKSFVVFEENPKRRIVRYKISTHINLGLCLMYGKANFREKAWKQKHPDQTVMITYTKK